MGLTVSFRIVAALVLSSGAATAASERGGLIYARACAACHGRAGRGDGASAAELVPRPRDFTAGRFRMRSTASGEAPLRADLEATIRRGLPGTMMPSFEGLLEPDEIRQVVDHVLSLGSGPHPDPEPAALRLPEFAAPTPEATAAGRGVFLAAGCWKCHGTDGSGRGPSARGLKTDEGRPIRPRDFRHDPFKRGRTPESVARAVLSGLIGTPMPSHAEVLVVPGEAIDAVQASIPAEARGDLAPLRRQAPSVAEAVALDADAWERLRDANLAALAHYVLSLDRRATLGSWLLHQRPEEEARQP